MPTFRPLQEVHLPLSGNVTQTINPWTWMTRVVGSQFGLINVNLGNTPDPEAEQAILDEVGTCGRQIGRIGDALSVLLRHLDRSKLNRDERAAIAALERFQAVRNRPVSLPARVACVIHRSPARTGGVDVFVASWASLLAGPG
jgi:hypothetical protein